jgi:hypothetical protein
MSSEKSILLLLLTPKKPGQLYEQSASKGLDGDEPYREYVVVCSTYRRSSNP